MRRCTASALAPSAATPTSPFSQGEKRNCLRRPRTDGIHLHCACAASCFRCSVTVAAGNLACALSVAQGEEGDGLCGAKRQDSTHVRFFLRDSSLHLTETTSRFIPNREHCTEHSLSGTSFPTIPNHTCMARRATCKHAHVDISSAAYLASILLLLLLHQLALVAFRRRPETRARFQTTPPCYLALSPVCACCCCCVCSPSRPMKRRPLHPGSTRLLRRYHAYQRQAGQPMNSSNLPCHGHPFTQVCHRQELAERVLPCSPANAEGVSHHASHYTGAYRTPENQQTGLCDGLARESRVAIVSPNTLTYTCTVLGDLRVPAVHPQPGASPRAFRSPAPACTHDPSVIFVPPFS